MSYLSSPPTSPFRQPMAPCQHCLNTDHQARSCPIYLDLGAQVRAAIAQLDQVLAEYRENNVRTCRLLSKVAEVLRACDQSQSQEILREITEEEYPGLSRTLFHDN